jgi:membrane-bound lytic murein transglycosylase
LKASRLYSFLQIHGPGCGGANGPSYRSIDKDLVEHEASVNQIRDWVQDYPELGQKIMWNNPAYLFFRCAERVQRIKGHLAPRIVHLRHFETWLLVPTL